MSQVAALEQDLDTARKLIATRQAVTRLHQNADFKTLIVEGFMLTEAARFAQESGDPALDADARADAMAMAQASGHLKRYLSMCFQMGSHAERTLGDLHTALEEARVEEGGE